MKQGSSSVREAWGKGLERVFLGAAVLCAGWLAGAKGSAAESVVVTADLRVDGPRISPSMFGVFFEDINFGGDGGLYAELVKNRAFEFTDPMMGWSRIGASGGVAVRQENPLNDVSPHYLRLEAAADGGRVGVVNEGFRGMGIKAGEKYRFSVEARSVAGAAGAPRVRVALLSEAGKVLAEGSVTGLGSAWGKKGCVLKPDVTDARARLRVEVEGPGSVDLDMISLFPGGTWKGREGGLRADLVQMLADLKPGFMRFPGGCIVEGRTLPLRYQWKTTIGPAEGRRPLINRWNDEFKHKPAPDYFQTFGLGFFEYFQMCEDIGASPLPILNCGMACQFNSGELVPLDKLDPFVQDALDLVEFANGPADSVWGAKRAAMGHPKPFGMKMLGVGNEQWGMEYVERYPIFAKALKARYPEIQLISSAGPGPTGDKFELLWSKLREMKADILDEHYYSAPRWFLENAGRYDAYDRHGPKVFAGEFAAQSDGVAKPTNRNNWECALAEAAFMTGLERNGDVVRMASYAPLFGHLDAWQWTPNLIWFDNLGVYGTPNYYVQQFYSKYRGTVVVPLTYGGVTAPSKDGVYVSATRDERGTELFLKVANTQAKPRHLMFSGGSGLKARGKGRRIQLACDDLRAENSIQSPKRVAPVEASFAVGKAGLEDELPGYSFTVYRLPLASGGGK